ncbi:hypothetical protein CsSME_00029554 [Camellia sinensis var. sinensis]
MEMERIQGSEEDVPLAYPCTNPLGCLGWEQDLGTTAWEHWRIVDWRLRPRDCQGHVAVSLQACSDSSPLT